MESEVLAVVRASPVRRGMGVSMLTFLGALLLYVALATPPALIGQVFLIATGLFALWMANRMRLATQSRIELTAEELRDSAGERIAAVADIDGIDRGFLAFKPSNGFMIHTSANTGARTWRPGLWWRVGRRIGIGGVAPGHQTKMMADVLAAMLAERET